MSKSEASERIRDIFTGILRDLPESFGEEQPFTELGGTSMDAMKLQMELRRTFGRKISLAELYELGSVSGIAERMTE
ncbi:MAG: acyl carrier protein [Oscillospiraceae bacterium]|nr:acyl carrier protein [Oscillospiraceae bacterium]MCR4761211.1 acyl carrier protein [Oscillospiraceae bacterium]